MLSLPTGLPQASNRALKSNHYNTVISIHDSTNHPLIAWYDFTDQSTVYKNNSGTKIIAKDERIGRIDNKMFHLLDYEGGPNRAHGLGYFLRAWRGATVDPSPGGSGLSIIGPNGDGGISAPTFKLNGVNGHSYAEFDRTGMGGFGEGLMSNSYYDWDSRGHGGGVGLLGVNLYAPHSGLLDDDAVDGSQYTPFLTNGQSGDYANTFSLSTINTSDITFFWVIKPDTANPSGSAKMHHWKLNNAIGSSANFEAYTAGSGLGGGTAYFKLSGSNSNGTTTVGDAATVTTGITVLMGKFEAGTNTSHLFSSSDGQQPNMTSPTATSVEFKTGSFEIGREWNGPDASQPGSGFGGEFYEIIAYKGALANDEITTVLLSLYEKYGLA